MIEGGCLIMLASVVIMFAQAGPGIYAVRRPVRSFGCGIVPRTAYPPSPPAARLAELVEQADRALERNALLRGVRCITVTYDKA